MSKVRKKKKASKRHGAPGSAPLNVGTDFMSVSLARLAHELKTPISAIAAAADVMRREEFGKVENEKYRTYIADIHTSALLSLTVIDRMLANTSVGDIAAGKQSETFAPSACTTKFDANALTKSVVSSMQPLADVAGVKLVYLPGRKANSDEPLLIHADQVSVTQMLLNLVNNAIKFTPSGGRVELHTKSDLEGGVVISIRDTGAGMSKKQIANALVGRPDPDQDGLVEGRGLGIGLPLVHALCKANGVHMNLASDGSAKGTSVTLTFPDVMTRDI